MLQRSEYIIFTYFPLNLIHGRFLINICIAMKFYFKLYIEVFLNNLLIISNCFFILFLFFSFIFISWRLITPQYCRGFCHTLTRISHGFTCIPHPDPPSHLSLYPIPLGLPSAPGNCFSCISKFKGLAF